MKIAQEQSGLADLRGLTGSNLPEIGWGDVPTRLQGASVRPRPSPVLRGPAFLAALNGEPWRPQM